MRVYVVETIRANGTMMFDHMHVALFDAIEEACYGHGEDACCDKNTYDDDFMGPCPGGCEIRSPRVVLFEAMRVE